MGIIITTKDELKNAIDLGLREFTVEGELAEKIKKSEKIKSLSKKSLMILSISIAMILATPITGGVSGATGVAGAGLTMAFHARNAAAVGSTASLSMTAIYAIIAIGGISIAIALYKEYDIEYSFSPTSGLSAKFNKR